jgi:hypothetical protein
MVNSIVTVPIQINKPLNTNSGYANNIVPYKEDIDSSNSEETVDINEEATQVTPVNGAISISSSVANDTVDQVTNNTKFALASLKHGISRVLGSPNTDSKKQLTALAGAITAGTVGGSALISSIQNNFKSPDKQGNLFGMAKSAYLLKVAVDLLKVAKGNSNKYESMSQIRNSAMVLLALQGADSLSNKTDSSTKRILDVFGTGNTYKSGLVQTVSALNPLNLFRSNLSYPHGNTQPPPPDEPYPQFDGQF